MEALRRHANKFKDQVARQQQAVIKQFGGTGYESSDTMVLDEAELQRHQQLEKLYRSTRAARDFQKEIIRATENLLTANSKHIEVGIKLSEDCYKYGGENMANDGNLGKTASLYGGAVAHIEKEYEDLNKSLASQIIDPLKAMAHGAPLEDARHLAQRYSRMRQEAQQLAAEISKKQAKAKEAPIPENTSKLQASESKMQDLKENMAVLGEEANGALSYVESQQQRSTYQRLVSMVESEKLLHLRIAAILDDVEAEMVSEKHRKESQLPSPQTRRKEPALPSPQTKRKEYALPSPQTGRRAEKVEYFLAEAVHAFNAAAENELNLAVGDFVVVRQVSEAGWSEGECKGQAGWFPSAYVERRQQVPSNKVFGHES